MVVPMVSSPPQRTTLCRQATKHRKDELPGARGFESSMRKVAVVKTGNGKHPEQIECDSNRN